MSVLKHPPQQFDFRRHWLSHIWPFLKTPAGIAALEPLRDRYLEIAEFKFEETSQFDADYAMEVLELDSLKASVCIKDLDWIRKTFESADLASLSLSIAEALYPEELWAIEEMDEHSVVTNERRSLVLDIMNYDRLSARASLLLAGVAGMESALAEINEFCERENAMEKARLEKMNQLLEHTNADEEAIPLNKNSAQ